MTAVLGLFVLFLVGAPTQATEPTIEVLRARAQERMRQDLAIYSAADFRALEELYQSANRDPRAAARRDAAQPEAAVVESSSPPLSCLADNRRSASEPDTTEPPCVS